MADSPQKDDEAKFNETLKRMLGTKPTPHKPDDEKEARPRRERDRAMRVDQSTPDKK